MMCICHHNSFCIQRDPHEESPHALRGSRLPMRWMRRKLRHPERVFHPQEKCSRKRREMHKIRMPHSQLWFPNWKTRRACGSRAFRSSEPGKRSLTDRSIIDFLQIHLCDHCGRNFVDEAKLSNHMTSHAKNGKIKKTSGSNYDCPHCPR